MIVHVYTHTRVIHVNTKMCTCKCTCTYTVCTCTFVTLFRTLLYLDSLAHILWVGRNIRSLHLSCVFCHIYMWGKPWEYFRELWKTGSHLGLNQGPLTLAVSALPPEYGHRVTASSRKFSISLCMCRQNPTRDQPVTPLHKGRSHTEWNILFYS